MRIARTKAALEPRNHERAWLDSSRHAVTGGWFGSLLRGVDHVVWRPDYHVGARKTPGLIHPSRSAWCVGHIGSASRFPFMWPGSTRPGWMA